MLLKRLLIEMVRIECDFDYFHKFVIFFNADSTVSSDIICGLNRRYWEIF
jgi:hypothetical protein